MAKYFEKFPKVSYNINRSSSKVNNYELVTNIMTRLRVLTENLDSTFNYYNYTVKDGDTPEILAEKLYGDAEAHWLILLTNNMVDPQYDWPLNVRDFDNFIISKYGSIATAQITTHHYEKIIKRVNTTTDTTTLDVFEISQSEYNTLPVSSGSPDQTLTVAGNIINTYPAYRNLVNSYDWEFSENEKRRTIKLIKAQYYSSIQNEFGSLMRAAVPKAIIPGIRVLTR